MDQFEIMVKSILQGISAMGAAHEEVSRVAGIFSEIEKRRKVDPRADSNLVIPFNL